jgi:hypothetical protein
MESMSREVVGSSDATSSSSTSTGRTCSTKTPLGKVAAKRVEIEFEADLRMARALSIATLYVVPGLGSVVEERQDSVRLLKVPIRGSEQVLVLISGPE